MQCRFINIWLVVFIYCEGLFPEFFNKSPFGFSGVFCQTLVETLEGTPGLRVIWGTFRPLLQGKVLYTPDTPATRLMVKEVKNPPHPKHTHTHSAPV